MRRPTIVRRHNGGTGAALLTAERTNYDALGRVTSVQAGAAFSGTSITSWQTVESRTYTPTGQVATVRNGANNTVTNTYDALDRLYQVTDPVGRRTRFVYDAAGQLTREIRAQGTPLQQDYRRYAYRPNGQISYVRDANNNRTTYIYDGFDRLERVRFPMPAVGANQSNSSDYEAYIYDAAGNRTSVRLRDGQTISFTYDALNRMTLKDVPGTAQDVFYAYDLAGRPLSSRFGSVSGQGVVFAYDSAGRMTSETSYGRAVSFQYDGAGNRTRLTWPDGQYVQYVWDGANRVSQVRANGASSGAGLLAQYGYDARSRPESLIRGGGSGPRTDYGFDAASRLTGLAHDLSVPASDQTLGFSWTAAGQLASRTMSNPAYRWTPPSGHAAAYQANGLNQYTSAGGAAVTHDARGNLTSDGSRTFAYDVENRLTSVSGSVSMTLGYDPGGRLYQTVSGSTTTRFLYDGDRLIAEYDGSGALLRRYVHGPGVDEPIVWHEGSGMSSPRWLISDHLGSVIAWATASGSTRRYVYGPYGEQDDWAGSRFRYTGQIGLPEARLYHYKARVYDPELGRFLQTDPIGYEDQMNLYAYVGNDPLGWRDPTGMCRDVSGAGGETHTIGLCLGEGLNEVETATLNSAIASMNAFAGYDVVAEIDDVAEQLFRSLGGDASAASNSLVALTTGTHQFFQNGPMSDERQGGTIAYSGSDLSFLGRNIEGGQWERGTVYAHEALFHETRHALQSLGGGIRTMASTQVSPAVSGLGETMSLAEVQAIQATNARRVATGRNWTRTHHRGGRRP